MTPSGKTTDIIKDLATFGAGFFVIAYSLVAVTRLTEVGLIDGATAMTFYTTVAAAAVAFLFGAALQRMSTRTFEKGLNTPGPNDSGTTVNAESATVTDSGPTTVTGKSE